MKAFGPRVELKTKPLIKNLKIDLSPVDIFKRIDQEHDVCFLLESREGPEKISRFSFLGFDPIHTVSVKNGSVELNGGEKDRLKTEDPLNVLRELVHQKKPLMQGRYVGGAVGYISYDAVRCFERLPSLAKDDLKFPDMEFGVFTDGIIIDHINGKSIYFTNVEDRFSEVEGLLKNDIEVGKSSHSEIKTNMTKEAYEEMVSKSKEYIFSGDVVQVVVSKRMETKVNGSYIPFYEKLRATNPSPYLYFLKFKNRRIIGSSPETLVRVEGRHVETYPIAGTRPRGKTPEEDERLEKELLADPKERAEHVMLVDLGRNDIGRVAKFGTVSVPDLMTIGKYSHVQHIVSRVVGELRDDKDCFDAMRGIFPAGTVSGAPKVRAMEIIDELEPTRRGPYAGGVGYFSFNGNMDTAIIIRTMVANGSNAYIQVGAGIVADSIPEREWYETEHKGEALIKSLEASE